MADQPFFQLFPEIAETETRCVTILPGGRYELPPDTYDFVETFCNDKGCDCRRVWFHVSRRSTGDAVADITYGWETPAFYEKWFGSKNPDIVRGMIGPIIPPGGISSGIAPEILDIFKTLLLTDDTYIARVKRHYRLFRAKLDGKTVSSRLTFGDIQKDRKKRKAAKQSKRKNRRK